MSIRRSATRPRLVAAAVLATPALVVGLVWTAAATTPPTQRDDVEWVPCDGSPDTQCGTLDVPVDWSEPDGEQVSLAVARRPAGDPDGRVGTLFFNPGGPGDGAVAYVAEAEAFFSETLRARFDLVGMDPRGVQGSAQVSCEDRPVIRPETDLWPDSEAEFDALLADSRALGSACLRDTGALVEHADTVAVARDHEALRAALGVDEVSWLGISYGTQVAGNYAELHPERTRAVVLDAALDHSLSEVQQVAGEVVAAEDSFNRFAAWCPTTPDCALQGQDVAAVFDALVAQADRDPIEVEGAVRPVTGEDVRMGTKGLLRFKEPAIYGPELSWAGLSRALQGALAGDASAFAVAPAGVVQHGAYSLLANACLDYDVQVRTWAEMQQRMELGRQLAPHLQGASETWQALLCAGWPIAPTNPPRPLDVRGVDALVVHAVHDPSVAYAWAHGLAAQIDGSHLLTRTGDGHTSYHTSPCARAAVDAFLVRPGGPASSVCAE